MGPERGAARNQPFVLDHPQRLQPDGRGQRVTSEGRTVAAWLEQVHDFARRDEAADRQQSAPQRLAQDQAIGADALVLMRKPTAGSSEPRLDFIQDQQHAPLAAHGPDLAQEAVRRNHDAGFALDRLEQHRAGVLVDEMAKAGTERPEVRAVSLFGGKSDDRGRAPVEVSAGHRDFGRIRRDSLHPITPAPNRLDGRLDRLGSTAGRQRPGVTGIQVAQSGQMLEERAQRCAVIGPRCHRDLRGLIRQRLDQARMRVAMADRRIGAHQVKIAATVQIEQPFSAPALQHHRDRKVVRCGNS